MANVGHRQGEHSGEDQPWYGSCGRSRPARLASSSSRVDQAGAGVYRPSQSGLPARMKKGMAASGGGRRATNISFGEHVGVGRLYAAPNSRPGQPRDKGDAEHHGGDHHGGHCGLQFMALRVDQVAHLFSIAEQPAYGHACGRPRTWTPTPVLPYRTRRGA